MRTYKKKLPEGVKKTFGYERGVKVRLLNKDLCKKKTEKKAK